MNTLTIKYVVVPGYVHSKNDGQTHYIGFGLLCRLYGVSPGECVDYSQEEQCRGRDLKKLKWLRVQPSGNYIRPIQCKT